VKTHPRAAGENVSVNIQHGMTVNEMQLVLSRVYAIAALDPTRGVCREPGGLFAQAHRGESDP
jgi:hypothetical protein